MPELKEVHKELILSQIKKVGKPITIPEVAAATGVPVLETEWSIKALMLEYKSRLMVTDMGDILYSFGESLHKRSEKSAGYWVKAFFNLLYKGFTWFYKAWIAITLVVYFVVFIVILIAAVIALTASQEKDNDNRGGRGGGAMLEIVFRLFWSIFEWNTYTQQTYKIPDNWGYPGRHYEPKKAILPNPYAQKIKDEHERRKADKNFIASVYDFVFGPTRFQFHPLANRKELANYLAHEKGVVTVSEIQALAGWKRDEAELFMTETLGAYNGKAEVNENGTLYGQFSDLERTVDKNDLDEPVIFFWDEYEPKAELTGNRSSTNTGIIAMNLFNMLMASFFVFTDTSFIDFQFFLLGLVPFSFSVLFFAIPLIRLILLPQTRLQEHKKNIRKRLMKAIFQKHKDFITLTELTDVANKTATTEAPLKPKIVDKVLRDFIYDLKGESSVNANNEMVYKFHDLNRELTDIENLRRNLSNKGGTGSVVFDTNQ